MKTFSILQIVPRRTICASDGCKITGNRNYATTCFAIWFNKNCATACFTKWYSKRNIYDVKATGVITTEGFVLLAGSTVNEKTSEKSLSKGAATIRKKYFEAGKVKDLTTTEDIIFSSSSAEADFVTGYSISGPASWKNEGGVTLKELETQESL